MAKKKSIRVDFVKSCITYNKLNKIAISGIENACKRLNEELEISSRQKVARGSNVSVFGM